MKSLFPIVLLTTLSKTLTLITLHGIFDKANDWRNTGYHLITCVRYNPSKETPGRSAFVPRHRQHTASTIGDEHHRQSPIQLNSRHSTRDSSFCISKQPFGRCADVFHTDHSLTSEAIYADDADVISTDNKSFSSVNKMVPTVLGEWYLYVSVDKTERTIIRRETDRVAEEWRTTKKLGSLFGNVEDLSRRKIIAITAFRGIFGCEDNTSPNNSDCVYRTHSCFQCYCTSRVRGA